MAELAYGPDRGRARWPRLILRSAGNAGSAGNCQYDLRDLQRMGQAGAVVVALRGQRTCAPNELQRRNALQCRMRSAVPLEAGRIGSAPAAHGSPDCFRLKSRSGSGSPFGKPRSLRGSTIVCPLFSLLINTTKVRETLFFCWKNFDFLRNLNTPHTAGQGIFTP